MRAAVSLFLGALLAAGAPAVAGDRADNRGEAKLAEALAGRTAGAPVKCLSLHNIRSSRIIDRTAILYEGPGNTLYVNRPDSGSESLDSWDVLVTDTHSPQLCNVDVVHLYDSNARMRTGFVFLGDFVPYTKAD